MQEELGLEYDEDVDVNFQPYSEMMGVLTKGEKFLAEDVVIGVSQIRCMLQQFYQPKSSMVLVVS